jgi:hypothetical protein
VINLGKQSLGSRIWIRVGDSLRLGHEEEDEVTDKWGHGVSGTREERARALFAWASPREREEERPVGFGWFGPLRGKRGGRPAKRASRPPQHRYALLFFYFICLFSKPFKEICNSKSNKIKTTPLNKINATA